MRTGRRRLLAGLVGLVVVMLGALLTVYWTAPGTLYRLMIDIERWHAGLSEQVIEVDGLQWHYLSGGQGPVLLLLHGFSADKDNWTRISPWLTDHYRVVAPDLPGFGASDAPAALDYDIESQARRALAFTRELGIEAMDVGGSSMGGYIAVNMAAQAPTRVRSLWLLAPGGVMSTAPSEMFQLIEQGENPLAPESTEDFQRTLDFVFHDPPFLPAGIVDYLGARQASRHDRYERIFDDLRYRSRPLEDYAGQITAPALIQWGLHDRVLHPDGGEVLESMMPRARFEPLPDAGHLPMIEMPEDVAGRYIRWRETLD